MHDSWSSTTIEELVARGILEVSDGYRTRQDQFAVSGLPILRAADVLDGSLAPAFKDHVAFGYRSKMGPRTSRAGDVLITTKGTVGRVAQIPREFPEHVYSPQVCFLRSLNANALAPGWLYGWARSPEFASQAGIHKDQTDMAPYVSLRDLRRFRITLPPPEEQWRIAGALGALDDLIDVNHRIRTTLDRKGIALVEDLVLLQRDRDVVMLEDAASLIETGRRPRGGVRGISEGVPSIGAESIDGLGVFDFSKTKFIPADFAAQMRTGVLESRDVLIYKDGGKPGDFRPHVGMYGDGFPFARMTINEHVYRVRAASPFTEPYLYFWLSTETSMAAMRRHGTGAAIPGLNSTALKSIPIAIPPMKIRQRLLPALEALVGEALAAVSEARRLSKARDQLLPLLLSGRVHVEDVAA